MKVNTWGYDIISSKHLVGKCVINGRHNMLRDRQTQTQREERYFTVFPS